MPSKTAATGVYFVILLTALAALFAPSFDKPPRSDYWVAFYHFHLVAASPGPPTWLSLCNYDPWQHGTFRPVAHLILYLQFRLFSHWFVVNSLTNFAMYFFSIVLLFLLARQFNLNPVLTAALLAVYAFLYSHFDIVTWTFQIFSTSSFCAFLLGFILCVKFVRTGRGLLLPPTALLFLFAMLCSEAYAFWPLSFLILVLGNRHLFPGPVADRKRLLKLSVITLAALYLAYAAIFIATRAAVNATGPLPRPTTGQVATAYGGVFQVAMAFSGVFFNLIYNGILVNLLPFVTEPTVIKDNIDMGGLLIRWYTPLPMIITLSGMLTFLILGAMGLGLYLKKQFRVLLTLVFLFFLYFSDLFVVTFARLTTNEPRYVFSQFRYQYIPNALMVLMLSTVLGAIFKPGKRTLLIIFLILLPILTVNIYYSHKYIAIINRQLLPLGKVLGNIRRYIQDGLINVDNPLLIDRRITRALPDLCWNEDMERFMKGTYQWFFPPEWMPYFTSSASKATWVIHPGNLDNIYKLKR